MAAQDPVDVTDISAGANSTASAEEAARKYCRDVLKMKSSDNAALASDQSPEIRLFATITRSDKLWSGGSTITYGFIQGQHGGTEIQRTKVRSVIEEWTWYANVKFKEEDSKSSQVKISFDPSPTAGSWSLMGKECLDENNTADGKATMNLAWTEPNEPTMTEGEKAVILHEFGHVLGMLHEHQSPAGGGIPLSNTDAAIRYYESYYGWDEQTVREKVIGVYNTQDMSSFSQVDRTSIMHYPMPGILTGMDRDIEYNYQLSDLDKAYMCIIYPRPNQQAHPNAAEWTFNYALGKAGITSDMATRLGQEYLNAHDADKTEIKEVSRIRSLFADWCKLAHPLTLDRQVLNPCP